MIIVDNIYRTLDTYKHGHVGQDDGVLEAARAEVGAVVVRPSHAEADLV